MATKSPIPSWPWIRLSVLLLVYPVNIYWVSTLNMCSRNGIKSSSNNTKEGMQSGDGNMKHTGKDFWILGGVPQTNREEPSSSRKTNKQVRLQLGAQEEEGGTSRGFTQMTSFILHHSRPLYLLIACYFCGSDQLNSKSISCGELCL